MSISKLDNGWKFMANKLTQEKRQKNENREREREFLKNLRKTSSFLLNFVVYG